MPKTASFFVHFNNTHKKSPCFADVNKGDFSLFSVSVPLCKSVAHELHGKLCGLDFKAFTEAFDGSGEIRTRLLPGAERSCGVADFATGGPETETEAAQITQSA